MFTTDQKYCCCQVSAFRQEQPNFQVSAQPLSATSVLLALLLAGFTENLVSIN